VSILDILNKYKSLTDETYAYDKLNPSASAEGLEEKDQLEKSIKFAEDEILKYKSRFEKANKDEEESVAFRKSMESDRFRNFLSGSYLERDFLETDPNHHDHHDTLEYSPTSRRESEYKGIMDTENNESYRSFDDSIRKIDGIIKNSPRRPDSSFKENKSPLSSRRGSNEGKKRIESPRTQNQHLGSPADNKNIVYDKFVNLTDNQSKSDDKSRNFIAVKHEGLINKDDIKGNQVSPLRGRNLAKNEISKLTAVEEEDLSKDITPVKSMKKMNDDMMSPMR